MLLVQIMLSLSLNLKTLDIVTYTVWSDRAPCSPEWPVCRSPQRWPVSPAVWPEACSRKPQLYPHAAELTWLKKNK